MNNIIEIHNLVKCFGEIRAVDGIDFSVERGDLFAFLGLNGAGKSTTINILCSILPKDGGSVTIGGYDLDRQADKIKPLLGIVFQSSVLDERLTVRENLAVRASYYGLRGKELQARMEELNGLLELKEILDRPFGKLSGGQKRRADIARGLLNRPELLFLDEPCAGLDAQISAEIYTMLKKFNGDGMTIVMVSHDMEEIGKYADWVAVINQKIEFDGNAEAWHFYHHHRGCHHD